MPQQREVVISHYYGIRYENIVPVADFMARRVVDAENKIVVEEVFDIQRPPNSSISRFIVCFTLEGDRIVVKEDSGAFSGEGRFVGRTEDWNSTNITVTFFDGTKVEIEDRFANQTFWARKKVILPDGNHHEYIERGRLIHPEEFDRKKSRILKRKPDYSS